MPKNMGILALAVLGAALAASAPAIAANPAVTKEVAANLPGYNIYRPTTLPKRPMPIIVWGNGGCARSDFTWTSLYERWVGAGYFVVTITTPPGVPAPTAQSAAPARGGGFKPEEQAAAIDWAIKENKSPTSPYRGKLDTKRIVAAGNSCGGISSLAIAAKDSDKRIKSIFVLSGSSIGPGQKEEPARAIMSKVNAPVLYVIGGPDDVATAPANMDYDLLPAKVPAMLIKRSDKMDHRTVSTSASPLRDAAEMSLSWFNATLYKDRNAAQMLKSDICSGCDPKIWSQKSKNF